MKWAVRILTGSLAVLAMTMLVAYLLGRSLPAEHVAEGSVVVNAQIDRVAERVRAVEQQPQWRSRVSRITIDAREPSTIRYREHSGNDQIAFVLHEREPGRIFESRITDRGLPFGGRWLIQLQARTPGTTRISIREEGVVHAPLYRALSKYVFGHDTTLNTYLSDLARSYQPKPGR